MSEHEFLAFVASATPLLAVSAEIIGRTLCYGACAVILNTPYLGTVEDSNPDDDPDDDPPPGAEMGWGDAFAPLFLCTHRRTCGFS